MAFTDKNSVVGSSARFRSVGWKLAGLAGLVAIAGTGVILYLLIVSQPANLPVCQGLTELKPMSSTDPATTKLTVLDFGPDKAFYRPGELARLRLMVQGGQTADLRLHLAVTHLAAPVVSQCYNLRLAGNGAAVETFLEVRLPTETPRGYGFDLVIKNGDDSQTLVTTSTAADVLSAWSQMPRYGFMSDFGPEETPAESAARAQELASYHVNVVQFYDWMYRHDDYLPPQDNFTDPLGRSLSLATVRNKLAAVQKLNMAGLAYGAVYGATAQFWQNHQDWGVYDGKNAPISLDKLFYVMNISAGSPWHDHILTEYNKAIQQVGFDGIHMDQYGFPQVAYTKKEANTQPPQPLYFDKLFPPIINDAAATVAAAKPSAQVIFNAVNNWPIKTVAPTKQGAIYIEVWPPYTGYGDLRDLIVEAKALRGAGNEQKQVILAAYLTPFLPADAKASGADGATSAPTAQVSPNTDLDTAERQKQAQNAALLTTATIFASGGFHLLLGEKDAALADPYYPKYGHFDPAFVPVIRRYYDFFVRYENLLADPTATDVSPTSLKGNITLKAGDQNLETNVQPRPNQVWAIMRAGSQGQALSLINLVGVENTVWNTFKQTPTTLKDVEVSLTVTTTQAQAIRRISFASPDSTLAAQELTVTREISADGSQTTLRFKLPSLSYWDLVLLEP